MRLKYSGNYSKNGGKDRVLYYRSSDRKILKVVPEFFKERLRMRDKMKTEEAKKIYNLRKVVVEPVFGNIKENLGFWEFKSRGLDGAKLELNLISIAHNLKKIWKAREKSTINIKNIIFDLIIDNNQMYCTTA